MFFLSYYYRNPPIGYAESKCPELEAGDVLVAINNEPVVKKSFDEIMKLLKKSAHSCPTQLTFLHIGSFESAEKAVETWLHDDEEQQEQQAAEFDVVFQPGQAMGIRFTEGYIMTNPLRLQHIERQALEEIDPSQRNTFHALLNQVIVRIGTHFVLGAPIDEVKSLLIKNSNNPIQIWFANPDQLNQDYYILMLQNTKLLKFFSFVPVSIMMEVPSVSFAVCNTSGSIYSRDQQQYIKHDQVQRSDGIRCDQYLMAINGIPTLRITSSGTDNDNDDDKVTQKLQIPAKNQSDFMYVITKALDRLVPVERTLTFRDLEKYQKEYKAQRPLSPWKKKIPSARDTKLISSQNTHLYSKKSLSITLKPRNFFRLLLEEHANKSISAVLMDESKTNEDLLKINEQRQIEKVSCEGKKCNKTPLLNPISKEEVNTTTNNHSGDHRRRLLLRHVTIPDTIRPIGMQLETNVSFCLGEPFPLTIFKNFIRFNGVAKESKQIQVGDVLLAINDVPIEDIPTDVLIQMLQQQEKAAVAPITKLRIARQKKEYKTFLHRFFSQVIINR
jgi:hypothetical protein